MREFQTIIRVTLVALMLGVAHPAQATWRLYVSGDFGYSIGVSKVSGASDLLDPPVALTGQDDDVSPLLGGAFGVEIPLDELTPWRMPWDLRLPDWPMRFELEATGLRQWEFETPGQAPDGPLDAPFHTRLESWTVFTNFWLDVPLRGLHRPIVWTSRHVARQPRLPRLRSVLRRSSLYAGIGIGASGVSARTRDITLRGEADTTEFAWQVGTGLSYELTERVILSVGYRYLRPGEVTMRLFGTAGTERGSFALDTDVHEARFTLRVRIFDLPYPWR